jgi:hypothetical protein
MIPMDFLFLRAELIISCRSVFRLSFLGMFRKMLIICPVLGVSRNPLHFEEPDGSVPRSQELTTGPYPEPNEPSRSPQISLRYIWIVYTYLPLGQRSGLLLWNFTAWTVIHSLLRCVLHARQSHTLRTDHPTPSKEKIMSIRLKLWEWPLWHVSLLHKERWWGKNIVTLGRL